MTAPLFLPEHGGNIGAAAKHFGIAKDNWLDLSSAVNPWHYPIPKLSASCFTELPYWQDAFLKAVESYYGCKHFVVGAGTQAFIESLPKVLTKGQILIPESGYQEHKKAWQQNHSISLYPSFNFSALDAFLTDSLNKNSQSHVLIINPNNPTAMLLGIDYLQSLAAKLSQGFYLIVDEAFIDTKAKQSLLTKPLANNIIVLRSLGKFFGLPGLRLGFAFANSEILKTLRQFMPLWQITGASQSIAAKALADNLWQQQTRQSLAASAKAQQAQLENACAAFNGQWFHSDLFSSLLLESQKGQALYQALASQGILLRFWQLNEAQVLLRFALCKNEQESQRLLSSIAKV